MLDLRVVAEGHALHPLELALQVGRPAAIRALGDHTEALIDAVDQLTGDPDAEDDDPAGDPLDAGEDEPWRSAGLVMPLPTYGADQSAGPINEAAAANVYRASLNGSL